MGFRYFVPPILLEPVFHLGEVEAGIGVIGLVPGLSHGNLALF